MTPEARPLSPEEFHLVAQVLALAVSSPWQRYVLRVMNTTGPGQGAKAAAKLWRTLPAEDLAALTGVLERLQPPDGWGRV